MVPLASAEAFSAVRLAPLTAGSVEGKRASGIVPLASADAERFVRFAPLTAGSVVNAAMAPDAPRPSTVLVPTAARSSPPGMRKLLTPVLKLITRPVPEKVKFPARMMELTLIACSWRRWIFRAGVRRRRFSR